MSQLCIVVGCGRPSRSNRLCASHRQSERRRQTRLGTRPLPGELSPTERAALDAIRRTGGEVFTRDVQAAFNARGWHIKQPNLVHALTRLLMRGLILQVPVPKGHPRRYVITAAGRESQ